MHFVLFCALLAQVPGVSPPGQALVTGRVVDAGTGRPVAAAVVTLRNAQLANPGQGDRVLTDGDGRYFFDRLATGTYTLTATKPGWIDGALGKRRPDGASQPLVLAGDDRKSGLDLMLWKASVLSGSVLDEAGEPVVGAVVRAVRRSIVAGRPRVELVRSAKTDDRGEFRLFNLTPGDYSVLLVATVSSGPLTFDFPPPSEFLQTMTTLGGAPFDFSRESGTPSGDGRNLLTMPAGVTAGRSADGAWMVVPPTFLGSSSASGMTFVTLASGEERGGLSLQARRVKASTIAGTLSSPDGKVANHVLHLLPADQADYPLFDVAQAMTDASGAFTFYGVPPGNYVLRVVRIPAPAGPNASLTVAYTNDPTHRFVTMTGGGPGGPPLNTDPVMSASMPIAVGDDPVRGVAIAMQAGARLAGRAVFDGSAPPPDARQLAAARVAVELANGYVPYQAGTSGRFQADGTFLTPSQVPARYYVRPASIGAWSVKSVFAGGQDITERPIDLSSDMLDLIVTYTDRPLRLAGSVMKSGAADPTASVLLFPVDRDSWSMYGANSRRVTEARANAAGEFSMLAPPPGDYFIVAVSDDELGAWREPAMLAKLSAQADRVQIRDEPPARLTLNTTVIR